MSSQKSSTLADPAAAREAVAPKRDRGRQRVVAILDAATAIFTEKGYEAATMTEIAARAATAIGSLYRFFPNKDTLADALLQRYAEEIAGRLASIQARAADIGAVGVADALFDLMIESGRTRSAAVALVDIVADGDARRASLRATMRGGLAAILGALTDRRPPRLDTCSAVLLALLKTVPPLAADPAPDRADRLAELRVALRLYVGHCEAAAAPAGLSRPCLSAEKA